MIAYIVVGLMFVVMFILGVYILIYGLLEIKTKPYMRHHAVVLLVFPGLIVMLISVGMAWAMIEDIRNGKQTTNGDTKLIIERE